MATVSHPMFHGQMGFESDGHQKKSFDDDDEHEGKRNNLNLSVKTEQHELNVADVLSEHSDTKAHANEVFSSTENLPIYLHGLTLNLRIVNVVCNFNLRCHIDLKLLANSGRYVIHTPSQGKVEMKLRNPDITANIWSSGKVMCIGAKNERACVVSARKAARKIQRVGFPVSFENFRINNTLAIASLSFAIDLHSLAEADPRYVKYEPELNPDAVYRPADLPGTMKIFSTGTITILAPRVAHCEALIRHFFPIALQHRTKSIVKIEEEEVNIVDEMAFLEDIVKNE